MDLNRFNQRYSTNLPYLKFIDIRYIVSLTFQKLKFCSSKLIPASYPILPTLIKIALRSTKGCSAYYKILNKKKMPSVQNSPQRPKMAFGTAIVLRHIVLEQGQTSYIKTFFKQ